MRGEARIIIEFITHRPISLVALQVCGAPACLEQVWGPSRVRVSSMTARCRRTQGGVPFEYAVVHSMSP